MTVLVFFFFCIVRTVSLFFNFNLLHLKKKKKIGSDWEIGGEKNYPTGTSIYIRN